MVTDARHTALAMVAVLALVACAAPAGAPSASRPDVVTAEPASTSSPSARLEAPDGVPEAAWTAILADLARRLDEAAVEPSVVSVDPMTWNDGSLGCPEPGQVYTQALVDGYRVVVEVDAVEYDFRVGSGSEVRLCDGPPIEGG